MTTEEFYAHALLAAFRSQETNDLLSAPKQNEVVSLANSFDRDVQQESKTILKINCRRLAFSAGSRNAPRPCKASGQPVLGQEKKRQGEKMSV